MRKAEPDTLHEWWIITSEPDVMDCIRRMHVPGRIHAAEQAKHGTEAMFYLKYTGPSDRDYDFHTTLDALRAMGARVYGRLPPRRTPPDDN